SPRLGVTQHPALWSPDFPRGASREGRVPRPPGRLLATEPEYRPRSAALFGHLEQLRGRAGGLVPGPLAGQPTVDPLIGQPVGFLVPFPRNVLQPVRPEP